MTAKTGIVTADAGVGQILALGAGEVALGQGAGPPLAFPLPGAGPALGIMQFTAGAFTQPAHGANVVVTLLAASGQSPTLLKAGQLLFHPVGGIYLVVSSTAGGATLTNYGGNTLGSFANAAPGTPIAAGAAAQAVYVGAYGQVVASPLGGGLDDWPRVIGTFAPDCAAYGIELLMSAGTWKCLTGGWILPSHLRLTLDPSAIVQATLAAGTGSSFPFYSEWIYSGGGTGAVVGGPYAAGAMFITTPFTAPVGSWIFLAPPEGGAYANFGAMRQVASATPNGANFNLTFTRGLPRSFPALSTASVVSPPLDIVINGQGAVVSGTGDGCVDFDGGVECHALNLRNDVSFGVAGANSIAFLFDTGTLDSSFEGCKAFVTHATQGFRFAAAETSLISNCECSSGAAGFSSTDSVSCTFRNISASACGTGAVSSVDGGAEGGNISLSIEGAELFDSTNYGYQEIDGIGSSGVNTQLSSITVRGGAGVGAYFLDNTSVWGITVSGVGTYGIQVASGAPTITDADVSGCGSTGIQIASPGFVGAGIHTYNNAGLGLYASSPITVTGLVSSDNAGRYRDGLGVNVCLDAGSGGSSLIGVTTSGNVAGGQTGLLLYDQATISGWTHRDATLYQYAAILGEATGAPYVTFDNATVAVTVPGSIGIFVEAGTAIVRGSNISSFTSFDVIAAGVLVVENTVIGALSTGILNAASTVRLGRNVVNTSPTPQSGAGAFSRGAVTLTGAVPVAVPWANLNANDRVHFTMTASGGTPGQLVVTQTPGTGFSVQSTNALDTSTYAYSID
jgi:hypothetical protein